MKNLIPQQQKFKSFSDLVDAATTTYTLSFKALKCSRPWAQTYIRPNVPHIYLSNGMGTNKPNYAKIVSQAVNKQNGNEDAAYSYESKLATTTSSGGLLLALQRAMLLLAPKGGIASTFTGPL